MICELYLKMSITIDHKFEVERHLCAWGNDAASEVLTEARQLLVENYFQTPSLALVLPCAIENFWKGSL
ncbi:hypothetical protein DCAR_0103148 [Daucus carota subsp. sativus]|uniref:Uncharacterized protein n=1 Tax=Daucus carota subsp. sativus TaxID=79200 RepID=A0AAF1AHS4_DAUCS|nr:hypothetical protein DCAR_0103148 [Daucus carota subsp. sativus]